MKNINFYTPLEELCVYCDRVRWGEYVVLGFGKWRHKECYPGSPNWLEWFVQRPRSKQTTAGKLLAKKGTHHV